MVGKSSKRQLAAWIFLKKYLLARPAAAVVVLPFLPLDAQLFHALAQQGKEKSVNSLKQTLLPFFHRLLPPFSVARTDQFALDASYLSLQWPRRRMLPAIIRMQNNPVYQVRRFKRLGHVIFCAQSETLP